MDRGKIYHGCCSQSDVIYIAAAIGNSLTQVLKNFLTAGTDIPAHQYYFAFKQFWKKIPDLVHGILVEILVVDSPDIIRLERSHLFLLVAVLQLFYKLF